MCGIAGIVGPAGSARAGDAKVMTRALRHRGPDDFGVFEAGIGVAGEPHAVALGHARLSILDVSSNGHQPMASPEGDAVIAYNGEIYNFRALREELRAEGHAFQTGTDTEVLLAAWRCWGEGLLERLVGMFAFGLWDARRERLLIARDRLGIKPLYYQWAEGVLLFGSELGALRAHPGFRPEIDRVALGRYLRHGYVAGERSIYAATRRLRPGHALLWEAGELELRRWWQPPSVTAQPEREDFAACVDRLEQILGDAVEDRLVSDVPLGAFLSGGIDSSTVVALMQERARGRVRTFSIGFREAAYDEAPHARAVAEALGTDHLELYVDAAQARDVAHQLPALYDEPFADASAIPTVLLSRLTREHVTVALSGDGGDELFGGYRQYRQLARLQPGLGLPRLLRRAAAALPIPGAAGRALAHLRAADARELALGLISAFPRETLAAACGAEGGAPAPEWEEGFARGAPAGAVRGAMAADAALYLPDDILVKVDRASMSVGLEARVPILDHRVVELAAGLPLAHHWHGGVAKAPLRAVLERRLPRALFDRPKQGFGIPIETLLAGELEDWSRRYLSPERLHDEGLIDPEGARRMLARAGGWDRNAVDRLWILLSFQRWHAHHHRGESDT